MSDELPPGTLSLETDAPAAEAPAPEPEKTEAPAPEPAAVVQADEDSYIVQADGKPINIGRVIAAERRREREKYEPVRQQAAQLANEVQQLRQQLRPPAPEPPKEPEITDDEATAEAKDLQLYDASGALDVKTSKRIIQKRRQEALQVAEAVMQRTVAPIQQGQARDKSAQHFIAAVTAKNAEGQPLFATRAEQEAFASFWAEQPAELTSDPKAAEVFLNAYVGQTARTTKRAPAPQVRLEPVVNEAPGGKGVPAYVMTELDKKFARAAGMTEKQYGEQTKGFQKDRTLVIGD